MSSSKKCCHERGQGDEEGRRAHSRRRRRAEIFSGGEADEASPTAARAARVRAQKPGCLSLLVCLTTTATRRITCITPTTTDDDLGPLDTHTHLLTQNAARERKQKHLTLKAEGQTPLPLSRHAPRVSRLCRSVRVLPSSLSERARARARHTTRAGAREGDKCKERQKTRS